MTSFTIAPDVVERVRAGAATSNAAAEQMPSVVQRILDMVPVNPIKAAAEGALLPLVVFTFIFAAALTRLEPGRREPVTRLFQAVGDAMLIVVRWVLTIAPVGIAVWKVLSRQTRGGNNRRHPAFTRVLDATRGKR